MEIVYSISPWAAKPLQDGQLSYIVEIRGEYWHAFKTKPMGFWTKHLHLATRMSRKLCKSYVDFWKIDGAKAKRI
jgi:hypothetical protein